MAPLKSILLLGLSVGALAIAAPKTGDEVDAIVKRGSITVGLMLSDRWPYFFTGAKGELRGIDIDVITAFAESLGVKAKFERKGPLFQDALAAAERGEVDVALSAFYPTVGRALNVSFTLPYCTLPGVFVFSRKQNAKLPAGKSFVRELQQGAYRIGTYTNTFFPTMLSRRFPKASLQLFSVREELWSKLKSGGLDIVYVDRLELIKTEEAEKDFSLYFRSEADNDHRFPVAMALSRNSHRLLELLNLWVQNESATGTLKEICTKEWSLK